MMMNVKKERTRWNRPAPMILLGASVAIAAASFMGKHKPDPDAMDPSAGACAHVVKDDRICVVKCEAYPFLLDAEGKVMAKEGKPIPNPRYSKVDCHQNDNVCDDDPKKVLDSAGNVMTSLPEKDHLGQTITYPLEGADSPDCIRRRCATLDNDPQMLSGEAKSLSGNRAKRKLTLKEIAALHASKGPFTADVSNTYETVSEYKEVCDSRAPVCGYSDGDVSVSVGDCFCPNLESCRPSKCGNGQLDRGEECDTSARNGSSRCPPTHVCSAMCSCVPKAAPKESEPVAVSIPREDAGAPKTEAKGPLPPCSSANQDALSKIRTRLLGAISASNRGRSIGEGLGIVGMAGCLANVSMSGTVRDGNVLIGSYSASVGKDPLYPDASCSGGSLSKGGFPAPFESSISSYTGTQVGGADCSFTVGAVAFKESGN